MFIERGLEQTRQLCRSRRLKNLDGKGQASRELDPERRAESVGEIGQRSGCHKFDQLTIAKKPLEPMDGCFLGSQVVGHLLRVADDIPLRGCYEKVKRRRKGGLARNEATCLPPSLCSRG